MPIITKSSNSVMASSLTSDGKQLTRAVPAIRGAICFVDHVDDAIVFNSITEVCISFDDDPLRAELSPDKEGTSVKIGESAVEQGN